MSFETRFFDIAEAETKELRSANERRLEMRHSEIAAKYPEIAALEKELSMTSSKMFTLIAGMMSETPEERGNSYQAKFDALKNENLAMQERERELLVKYGYPENYLDTIYTCPVCRDTGELDGKRCSCFMERVKKAASEEMNRTSPLKLCSFGDFKLDYYDNTTVIAADMTARDFMNHNFSYCTKYADDFHLPCESILMLGNTGLGKTHLSLSIASEVLKKGYSVIYGSAPDLFRKIEKEHFGSDKSGDNTIDMLLSTDLLILDDVGAEFESKFYVSVLYNIINNRMNASLPTIVSTNLSKAELKTRYGDRISSRLFTMKIMNFVGEDVRVRKNRNR